MVLAALAIVWAVVLGSYVKEKSTHRTGDSVSAFKNQLSTLQRTQPGYPARVAAGTVLCHESYTGRYFECDMETLRKAENEINSRIVKHDRASLNDLYYILGLGATSYSDNVGWDSARLLELEFSTVLSQDGKPCLAFDYNYTKPV